MRNASRPMGGGCKTGPLPSCGGKDPRRPNGLVGSNCARSVSALRRKLRIASLPLLFLAEPLRWVLLGSRRGYGLFRQGLWLCALRLSAGLPKQISYLRQPDELSLRAIQISGLRISRSLLSVRFPNTRLCVRYLSISLPMKTPYLAGGRAWRLRALASCLCVAGFPNGFAVCILLSRARTA